MKWLDGKSYTGEWFEDQMNGQGAKTYPDGKIYQGGWKDGESHGEGMLSKKGKSSKAGIFENGRCVRWYDSEELSVLEKKIKNEKPIK